MSTMERYKCKLCPSRFQNGRALGGHMRSHVVRRHKEALASPSASSSSFPAEAEPAAYSLRQNPRRSVRLVDPEFAASVVVGAAAAESTGLGCAAAPFVFQDGESDAESAFRRSRRRREDWEAPLSSITDASSEEDVARCLVLFSRDAWARREEEGCQSDEVAEIYCDYKEEEEEEEEEPPIDAISSRRLKYKCSTCGKFFRSYQALGGHRASHRRVGAECIPGARIRLQGREPSESNAAAVDSKLFQCSHCYRIFPSGQALGGHKRTHLSASGAAALPHARPPSLQHASFAASEGSIDLNLPPPLEEDEVELSGLSVATAFPSK